MRRTTEWPIRPTVVTALAVLCCGLACGHPRPGPAPAAVRLVDLYRPASIAGRVTSPAPARTEWRFDGAAASVAPGGPAATRGWTAAGVAGLAIRDGRLTGRASTDFPLLHVEWPGAVGNLDSVDQIEVRLRVSGGDTLGVDASGRDAFDFAAVLEDARLFPWLNHSPLTADGQPHTVTVRPVRPVYASDTRQIFLRPTNVAGAEFAIESVRLVTRREHLAAIPSGVSWQGLSQVYRETLVARAPEVLRFEVDVPPRAVLDLGVGTPEAGPVTFVARTRPVGAGAAPTIILQRTVTTPHRWDPVTVDLSSHAGEHLTLELAIAADSPGALGFWGAPVVRSRVEGATTTAGAAPARPQGVIVVWTDTLRRDHLSAYGYSRPTSPFLERLAREGTRFDHCVSQATWTKVATPSLFTALYPATHGVTDFSDRLSSSFTTMAEVFRAGGFATLSLSSIAFTGQFTNLHQGFEELHEDMSLPDRDSSKTTRVYVDRLLPWLERHRELPFFAFLHIADAHDPYQPYPPYDTLFNDPAGKEEHERERREVRKLISDPLLKGFGMPTRAELVAAGFDPERYERYDQGWYDGSIRAMDAELARVAERLRELGLDRRTLVVVVGDHGEEFLDHGRTFHGQSTYGELSNVPLILWQPGVVPAGKVVGDTVETIDVMPTILDSVGLATPREASGRSFRALLGAPGAAPWRQRPAFTEKNRTYQVSGAPSPIDTESFAVVDGGWKLVHNTVRPRGGPEFELYALAADPRELHDVAAAHPDVVARLSAEVDAWHAKALAARRPTESAPGDLAPEELERLRSLGYVQ
jgi:arylsulfatase A-like enzyme